MTATALRMWALEPSTYLPPPASRPAAEGPADRVPFPVFLIEHERGLVLFDAGLAPEAAGDPAAVYGDMARLLDFDFRAEHQIERQLAQWGHTLGDVGHVIASHLHFDHCGGLKLFPHAVTYIGAGEREYADSPEKFCRTWYRPADFDDAHQINWRVLPCDHDIFGDGSVVALSLPGHSPGSMGALVRLPGRTILLTGDAVHTRAEYEGEVAYKGDHDTVTARATLRKMKFLEQTLPADVWINHDPSDWARFGGAGEIR